MLQTEEDVSVELDTLREYLRRRQNIENEIAILKEDLKNLNDEFKDKLDLKTVNLAASVVKAKSKVKHKFTFENFLNVLESEGWFDK